MGDRKIIRPAEKSRSSNPMVLWETYEGPGVISGEIGWLNKNWKIIGVVAVAAAAAEFSPLELSM